MHMSGLADTCCHLHHQCSHQARGSCRLQHVECTGLQELQQWRATKTVRIASTTRIGLSVYAATTNAAADRTMAFTVRLSCAQFAFTLIWKGCRQTGIQMPGLHVGAQNTSGLSGRHSSSTTTSSLSWRHSSSTTTSMRPPSGARR